MDPAYQKEDPLPAPTRAPVEDPELILDAAPLKGPLALKPYSNPILEPLL